ncbi:MAG: immunoglobulin-like domain-containing protein [Arenicella sp.]
MPPVITLAGYEPGDTIHLLVGNEFTVPSATAIDDIDGAVAVTVTGAVNINQTGSYNIAYRAVDSANNASNVNLTIHIRDAVDLPNAVNSVRQFTFNHSLWQHNFDSNAVTGYWVGDFANASNTTYAWNGQFGQLDYHGLPPSPNLGSLNSEDLWNNEDPRVPMYRETFEEVDLDNLIIMPDNFSQGGVSDVSQFHLDSALRVIDYLGAAQPDKPIIIYEHWPEAVADVLNDSQWNAYHAQTRGVYHQWFLNYQNALSAQRPNLSVRMVPVGPIIADILNNPALSTSSLAWTDLYEDNAPHGTSNLYFLAGLVTYQAMFGQPVTSAYSAPNEIDGRIASEFTALNDYVWQRLNFYHANGVRVWAEASNPVTTPVIPVTQVSNSAELNAAINSMNDGGIISLQPGIYSCIQFEDQRFTAESPLILQGTEGDASRVMIEGVAANGGRCTHAVNVVGSSYIGIRDISVQRGLFGLTISSSDHIVVDNVDVSQTDQSGIHINQGSSDIDIVNSRVFNTGLQNPQWGECIYVGTGGSSGFPDQTVRVWIENNEVYNCGYAEGINVKPEVFDTTVINNYVHDISPGHPDYVQYNSAAITVEGGRGSNPDNNHRPNDERNVWVESNLIEGVTKSVLNDTRANPVRGSEGMRSFASGIMVGGTGVHVVANTISSYEEHGLWLSSYGNLGLPVYAFGNQISVPSIESPDDNVPNQVVFQRLPSQLINTSQQPANTQRPQAWLSQF